MAPVMILQSLRDQYSKFAKNWQVCDLKMSILKLHFD